MGLFDKFNKTEAKIERISIFETDYQINKSSWFEVFSACLGQVMAIQDACREQVVQGQNWNVDFATAQLIFGNQSYPVQFLGSESNSSNTWKWGWDNVNGFHTSLIELANTTRSLGEKWDLEPLSVAGLELDDTFNGHTLSVVACGVSKDNYCYYRGPHDRGAVLMAFSDVPNSVFNPVDVHKFISIAIDCIQNYVVEHKIFIESFLNWNKIKYNWEGQTIIAEFLQELHIEFEQVDEFLRVSSIKTK